MQFLEKPACDWQEDEEDFELELDDKLPTEMEHPTLLAGPGVEVQPETRAGVPSFGPPPGPPPSGLPGVPNGRRRPRAAAVSCLHAWLSYCMS